MLKFLKGALTLMGAALVGLTSQQAFAQGVDEFGAYGSQPRSESVQHAFEFEIRFGPYLPNIDDKVAGTPFRDVFGDDNRYLIGVEFGWQPLRLGRIASFGPSAGLGITAMSAGGLLRGTTSTCKVRPCRAEQDTTLTLLPWYVVGVLRVDALARSNTFPLVGYVKAGFGDALWWTNSGGDASEVNGIVGRGNSWGYQYALGAMVLLDYFDRDSAASMDASTDILNSYVFLEFYSSSLDGFGSANQLQAGTTTWMTGVAVEF